MARRPSGFRIDNPAWPLIQALISYWGTTDAAGGAGGATLLCADLVNQPEFNGNQVVIISGAYGGQARDIDGTTLGGVVTPHLNFGGVIPAGIDFAILSLRMTPAEVAALIALVTSTQGLCYYGVVTGVPGVNQFEIATLVGLGDAKFIDLAGIYPYYAFVLREAAGPGAAPQGEAQPITNYGSATGGFLTAAFTAPVAIGDEVLIIHPFLARIMNLYGLPPAVGSVPGNWQSGVATSGEAGADLVTLGAANTKYKLHSLIVSIHALTAGAVLTVKMFQLVTGTERKVYQQNFVQGTSPNGLWIVDASVGIHEALRVEVESNTVADNGLSIDYDYMLEAM